MVDRSGLLRLFVGVGAAVVLVVTAGLAGFAAIVLAPGVPAGGLVYLAAILGLVSLVAIAVLYRVATGRPQTGSGGTV